MTEKPTLSIDATEWRVLFASNVARLNQFIEQTTILTPENVQQLHDHLDRAKVLATAWHRSQVPVASAPVEQVGDVVQANGAVKPKRGGWPKGKKRNAPNPQAVQ